MTNHVTWIVEPDVFSDKDGGLVYAARCARHTVFRWADDWQQRAFASVPDPVVFHGSLGTAAFIRTQLPWKPGAFCAVERFHCLSWYPQATPWLLHQQWVDTTVEQLVANPEAVRYLGSEVFIRPDSPLKPFSGRVLPLDKISLATLDHGFYYDDPALRILVAPVRNVAREWRYVVVNKEVVAGSAYSADRQPLPDTPEGEPGLLQRPLQEVSKRPKTCT